MKHYLSYILFCLLAVLVQPALAQRNNETKSQPDFPAMPYTLTYTAAPAGGTVKVSIPDNANVQPNATVHNGTVVTLTTTPDAKYKPTTGYPKAYKTGSSTTSVTLSPVTNQSGVHTFTMPSYPVTIDMQYTAKSTNANLSGLKYKIGDTEVSLSGFSAGKTSYDVTLPDDTDPKTIITLSGTKDNEFASLPATAPSVTLSDGKGSVTLKVTAEDGTEQAYTLNFTVPKYAVNFNTPTNGSLSLKAEDKELTNGCTLFKGTTVTLITTPEKGYIAKLGYPNISFLQEDVQKALPFKVVDGTRTFTMPSFPVTIEMEYAEIPGNDTRLQSLSYKVGEGEAIPISGFNNGKTSYQLTLPAGTALNATITLISQSTDSRATITCIPETITLNGGQGSGKLIVTAHDNSTKQEYTIGFAVAEDNTHIVTLTNHLEGGTISATYSESGKTKVLKSGDAVPENTELTLSNTPLPGYRFESYAGAIVSDSKVTITTTTILSATFSKIQGELPEIIGTEAKPEIPEVTPIPEPDAPIVIIPDAGALPSDTELSELRLIKDTPTEENITKVEALIQNEQIVTDKIEILEITLVKITTTIDGSSGETNDIKITPVQPSGKVKVRITYPEGTNRNSHDFTIVHLKSDGTTELYTVRSGGLLLADSYIELTVNSFSPFGIAYKKKSAPVPPTVYYTVALPETEGIILDKTFGNHYVEEGSCFSFSLTLKEGYKLHSKPVVTTSKSDAAIEPRQSDGKYVINNISSDLTVIIRGICKDDNTSVSNASITAGLRVWSNGKRLHIQTDRPEKISIYTLSGELKKYIDIPTGDTQLTLPENVYIIKIGQKVFKVLIR